MAKESLEFGARESLGLFEFDIVRLKLFYKTLFLGPFGKSSVLRISPNMNFNASFLVP